MGIDSPPFLGKYFLYDHEAHFISILTKSDKSRAIKFKNASRFIDEECNSYDSGESPKSFHVIYPNELQLKFEHNGLHITFLDLDISTVDGIYEDKLHNNYPRFIVCMPKLRGNIPAYAFYR